jgi:glycosyltransferase involved in cell wall biosynthesis
VLFVESTGLRAPALRASSQDRRRALARLLAGLRGPQRVGERLWVLAPLVLPPGVPDRLRELSDGWLVRTLRRTLRRLGLERPVVWAFLPTAHALVRELGARRVVYHCVDHYAANPGVDAAGIEADESRMLRTADVVLASSPELAARLREQRADVRLVANVADIELFGRALHLPLPEPGELSKVPRPRAIYVGNLAGYRVDFELLRNAAVAAPEIQWILVGAVGLGDPGGMPAVWSALTALPNVRVFAARPQEALPAWLRHCDVAIVPFLDNAHTRASLPLKLWEYLGAGLPVVATPLPNLEPLAADGTIRTARGSAAFADAVRGACADRPERRRERHRLALAHDWRARIEELAAILAEEPGAAGRVR